MIDISRLPLSISSKLKDFGVGLAKGVGELATGVGYLADQVPGYKGSEYALSPDKIALQKQQLTPQNKTQQVGYGIGSLSPGMEFTTPALKKIGVPSPLAFGIGLGIDIITPGGGELGKVDDIAKEARKYKSAEEFVKAQENIATGFSAGRLPKGEVKTIKLSELPLKGEGVIVDESLRSKMIRGHYDPIILSKDSAGKLKIVDGGHRLATARDIGLDEIKTIIVPESESGGILRDVLKAQQGGKQFSAFDDIEKTAQEIRQNWINNHKLDSNQTKVIAEADDLYLKAKQELGTLTKSQLTDIWNKENLIPQTIEELTKIPKGVDIKNPDGIIPVSKNSQFTRRSFKHFLESRTKAGNTREEIDYLISKAPEVTENPELSIKNSSQKYPDSTLLGRFYEDTNKAVMAVLDKGGEVRDIISLHFKKKSDFDELKKLYGQ